MSRDKKRVLAGAVAEVLWAAAHGTVSLEQTGHLAEEVAAERHDTLLTASLLPFLASPGGGGGHG